jgi:hypothetical protein
MRLTLYDIMAEDMYIQAKLIGKQVETKVIDENDAVIFQEVSNIAAWDSLVYFAKQILNENRKIEGQLNAINETT